MPKLRTGLKHVRSNVKGCEKPKCSASRGLNRHHKRHEAMWLGVWAGRRRGEEKWTRFVYEYYQFLEERITRICPRHHAEIHRVYDEIIASEIAKIGRPLADFSWKQAEKLMDKLEEACHEWLKKETKGLSPAYYEKHKKGWRKGLREKYDH